MESGLKMRKLSFGKSFIVIIAGLALLSSCNSSKATQSVENETVKEESAMTSRQAVFSDMLFMEEDEALSAETATEAKASRSVEKSTDSDNFTVNVEALKNISGNDKFGVRIEQLKIIPNVYSGYSYVGNNVVRFTVKNNTDKTVTGLKILLCGYGSSNKYTRFSYGGTWPFFISIPQIIWDDLSITPGSSQVLEFRFKNYEEISGAQAIVSSYTAASKIIANTTADKWVASIKK